MLGGIAGQFRAASAAGRPPGRFPARKRALGFWRSGRLTLGRGVSRSGMPRRLQLRSRTPIEFRGLEWFPDRRACSRGLWIPAVPPLADRPSRGAGYVDSCGAGPHIHKHLPSTRPAPRAGPRVVYRASSEVSVMEEIDSMRARLEAAGELTELLVAAADAFSLLLATCRVCEERASELFAAFAFASAAAAQGRLIIDSAPSLAASPGTEASLRGCAEPDLAKVADGLAGLAQVLGDRLSAAAQQGHDRGDREACQDAAAEAMRIYELLAPDR